ncbi:MAG: hypothetical protein ACTSVB_03975 [Candidatus Heimdallarchaeaceae archaeon]
MKTVTCKVKLVFRNGIGLVLPEDSELELSNEEKYALIFSSGIGRTSSVFAEINEIAKKGKESLIYLDKRIAGEIGDGEEVTALISSAPPRADIVFLAVPEAVTIPGGDWSSIVREGNIGKIIDYGTSLSFIVPSTLREPYIVQSQIISSLPFPPVKIHEGTKFTIVKKKQMEFTELIYEAYKKREERALVLKERIENGYYDALMELKNNKLDSLGRSIEFHAKPKVAFKVLKTLFDSYKTVNEQIVMDSIENFIGNLMFVSQIGKKDISIVELIVTGREKSGNIAIWVYGYEVDQIHEKLYKEVIPKINTAIEGVKEGPELIPMYCAGNCGELLDLKDMNENGVIECPACGVLNLIPPNLRIH